VGYRIENNILFGNDAGLSSVSAQIDHNLFFDNRLDCIGGCTMGASDQACDPGFSAPDAGDYTLGSCQSCAVDKGIDLGPDQPDVTYPASDAGYWGAAPDLGAFESACGAPPSGADAGGRDAGSAARYAVGCACGFVPSFPTLLVLAVLVALLARRGHSNILGGRALPFASCDAGVRMFRSV
jgi:hypothetical protein